MIQHVKDTKVKERRATALVAGAMRVEEALMGGRNMWL